MSENKQESSGCTNPVIIAAFIGGFFAIIAAVIGAYAVFMAANKTSSVPQQSNPSVSNVSSTTEIAGTWVGTVRSADGTLEIEVVYVVQNDCEIGKVCGTFDTPNMGCQGNLIFNGVSGSTYEFVEKKTIGPDFCADNGVDRFALYSSNQVNTSYSLNGEIQSTGLLIRK